MFAALTLALPMVMSQTDTFTFITCDHCLNAAVNMLLTRSTIFGQYVPIVML